ncbi:hypothetical protein ZOSMA_1133G00040 [Zostera marina]|uniref:Uncharacterized protein n=1 Tax=Zostera marina TaxID=29655 RepID=A0A0K9Q548_ZOSMR|nr:hypothetical protein ZOSMA_1133G00040 [Zostera marina]
MLQKVKQLLRINFRIIIRRRTMSWITFNFDLQERYMQLSEIEDQVKTLTEQLSCAQAELTTKNALIKQHTKVAEEAVSR